MQAVIVYESIYGNTRQVAEAVAEGCRRARPDAAVQCVPAAEAGPELTASADLLVVGGPTHMRGMSSGLSRRMAVAAAGKSAKDEDPHPAEDVGVGLRTWFHSLPRTDTGHRAAAFDTRGDARGSGGAAKGIAHRLSHLHYELAAEPTGFIVEDGEGPLREGELERARQWGAALV
ncbi:flavodoxin family protein [Kitasatospora sp. NPDC059571]|uniref:flavodoxin family protein n=1 Tax=Kitasatospora sp. NPDC059571 TaxID=3346871 RepID=UPI0036BECCE0